MLQANLAAAVALLSVPILAGCASTEQTIGLGLGLVTAYGAQWPSSSIEQVYYLGVFDPHEQLPPTVFRVRVRGQASAISSAKFASGWVPAQLVDSLATELSFAQNGTNGPIAFSQAAATDLASLTTERRMMLFGPEGFREAPADHRLVIVMGSDPQAFFQAIDETVGHVAAALDDRYDDELARLLFEAALGLRAEREDLEELERDYDALLPEPAAEGRT